MQNELTIQDNFPELREENLISSIRRRENYSLARDLRAKEDNEVIARRLEKDKAKKEEVSTILNASKKE
ncbi:MAG TPA: hypothetical protein VMV74_03330 [Bacteroidales bacterium]|nr:hypothetical protein [Bacteroidales bacterium]